MNDPRFGRLKGDRSLSQINLPLRGRRRLAVVAVISLAAALVLIGLALAIVSELRGSGPVGASVAPSHGEGARSVVEPAS